MWALSQSLEMPTEEELKKMPIENTPKEKEEASNYIWRYPNADGSEDKRIKDNVQKANYFTFWRCKKCNALTKLQHDLAENPSSSVKVIQVMLSEDGEGERTAKDWAIKGFQNISGVRE